MAVPFIEKLRMANIFPTGAAGDQTPFGMPNMNPGMDPSLMNAFEQAHGMRRQDMETDRLNRNNDQLALEMRHRIAMGSQPGSIQQQQGIPGQGNKPMNVVVKEDINPLQRANLDLRRAELAQRGQTASGKQSTAERGLDIRQGDSDIRQQRADIYGQEHNLSNADRLRIQGEQRAGLQDTRGTQALAQIGARGGIQKDLQDIRGTQGLANIAARNAGSAGRMDTRGNQRLAEIAANVAGKQGLQDSKAGIIKPLNPNQIGGQRRNAATELAMTRPELAQFVKPDEKGNPTNTAPEGSPEWHMINNIILGSTGDTQLPSDNVKPNKPGGVKPGASKYKVAVVP